MRTWGTWASNFLVSRKYFPSSFFSLGMFLFVIHFTFHEVKEKKHNKDCSLYKKTSEETRINEICSENKFHAPPKSLTGTNGTCTNLANPWPSGDPLYKAIEAPLIKVAYTSHGPIIHPRFVGQATTSPLRMSMWDQASAAAFRGVACVQGIAFGSPTKIKASFALEENKNSCKKIRSWS